ncbi:MAG: LURP-one-related family protein [Clostridia bacterium]|nr:LURP-one-related family protein [Clostridia bacterium]
MRLYIKQKVFSWKDKFTVKDEYGEDRYKVEGEFFSIGRKLHVCDMAGSEVVYIAQEIWSWMAKYHVHIRGHHAADVKQKFSWFRPKYELSGPECSGWTVDGSFWEHDYEVLDGTGNCIVRIFKEWMTWGDSYVLDIADPADELLALALVLTIDCVKASQNN